MKKIGLFISSVQNEFLADYIELIGTVSSDNVKKTLYAGLKKNFV
jgi:hypothetical protein